MPTAETGYLGIFAATHPVYDITCAQDRLRPFRGSPFRCNRHAIRSCSSGMISPAWISGWLENLGHCPVPENARNLMLGLAERRFEVFSASWEMPSNINIGRRSPAFPVTPPGVRVRTGRFGGLSYRPPVNLGIPSE